jgi:hypothetical protein
MRPILRQGFAEAPVQRIHDSVRGHAPALITFAIYPAQLRVEHSQSVNPSNSYSIAAPESRKDLDNHSEHYNRISLLHHDGHAGHPPAHRHSIKERLQQSRPRTELVVNSLSRYTGLPSNGVHAELCRIFLRKQVSRRI